MIEMGDKHLGLTAKDLDLKMNSRMCLRIRKIS